eukprot:g1311.t1
MAGGRGGDPEQTEEGVPVPFPTESTSNLTRAGSLTPQWMQAKNGGGISHPTRTRLGSDLDRQPDSARRGRTDSIGGQEALINLKTRETDRGQSRAPKRTPEERESWKSKERWAAGPDSARKWTGVPISGREREGWTSNDSMSRSVGGDRWNTEGGRWTDERRHIEEKEYVPKNSRWNDEERGERWRSALSARGGEGGSSRSSRMSPGPKSSLTRRTASEVPVVTDINGLHSFSKTQSTKSKFSREQLLKIYHGLLYTTGSVLPLPAGVDVTYPGFLKTDRESMNATESESVENTETQEDEGIDRVSSMELEADSWVYKDPSGVVRGPYTKEEVMDWWQEGYFPLDLQIQSQLSSKENWMPLKKLLSAWKVPLDRLNAPQPLRVSSLESEKLDKNLEHTSSLPTVGSHIPVSALMEAAALDRMPHPPPVEDEVIKPPQVLLQNSPVATTQQQVKQKMQLQSPVSDLQQTMQTLMLQQQQQQKQNQATAAAMGMNFTNNPLAPNTAPGGNTGTGLRPGFAQHLQQNNPLMTGGFGLQQHHPTGALQDNALLSPAVIEALNRRVQAQQQLQQQELNRSQLQGQGFNFNLNPAALNRGQMTGNANLAALLQRNNALSQHQNAQQILQELQQRNMLSYDSQRLLEARNLNPQATQNALLGAPGANSLNSAIFGGVHRPQTNMFPGLQAQANWNPTPGQTANPGGGYPALNSLLQRPQSIQAQAQLLGNLQGMRFPEQMGNLARQSPTAGAPRDNLLSLSGLQSSGSLPDGILQQRQRSNMSPRNTKYPFQPDPNFALLGQTSSANSPLQNFNFAANQQTPPFPQHILQHLSTPRVDPSTNVNPVNPLQSGSNPVSSPVPVLEQMKTPVVPESQSQKPGGVVGNAWGVSSVPSHPASLLEIQEEEIKGAAAAAAAMSGGTQQQNSMKERQVQAPTASLSLGSSSWNVPHVKPTSFMDIMQEDEASKKQTQNQIPTTSTSSSSHQSINPGPKKGSVWTKIATTAPAATGGGLEKSSQTPPHGFNTINSNTTPDEEIKKEAENEGFRDLNGARSSSVFESVYEDNGVVGGGGGSLFPGQSSVSVEFCQWCKDSMVQLGGTGDFALIEFLMSLKSRSEIAEYIQEYFTDAPSDKLSSFITEFMKRKDVNDNQMKKEKSKKTKSKANSGDSSMKRNSVDDEAISTSPDSGGGVGGLASDTSTITRTGSVGKPTTRARDVKPKGKKTAKGQHLPPDMLGFKSNVNLDARYRSGSTG